MTAFRIPADIGNRALQHMGASRMDPTLGFRDDGINASEISFAYDKLREAELQRRYWSFSIKRAALRPIDTTFMLLAPALWSPATTYFVGSIVIDENGSYWISNTPTNLNNDPLLTTFWDPYFGPRAVPPWDTTGGTAYSAGELVYTAPGDGTNKVFLSLVDSNSDNPATATTWDATVTYAQNSVVTVASVAYMSLIDLNLNQAPASSPSAWTTVFVGGSGSVKWLEIGGSDFPSGVSLRTLNILYPLGAGPASQTFNRNAYMLPAGYLRLAPQNPKSGIPFLGGPSGNANSDWMVESDFLVTFQSQLINLRFVADVTDVSRMHTMFCEGLAARIAFETVEKITQSTGKKQVIGQTYAKWMKEAGQVDAIEEGPQDSPQDDYITVRA